MPKLNHEFPLAISVIFPIFFIINIFKQIEKLRELHSHYLDSNNEQFSICVCPCPSFGHPTVVVHPKVSCRCLLLFSKNTLITIIIKRSPRFIYSTFSR